MHRLARRSAAATPAGPAVAFTHAATHRPPALAPPLLVLAVVAADGRGRRNRALPVILMAVVALRLALPHRHSRHLLQVAVSLVATAPAPPHLRARSVACFNTSALVVTRSIKSLSSFFRAFATSSAGFVVRLFSLFPLRRP
jgi:hypothetical protein